MMSELFTNLIGWPRSSSYCTYFSMIGKRAMHKLNWKKQGFFPALIWIFISQARSLNQATEMNLANRKVEYVGLSVPRKFQKLFRHEKTLTKLPFTCFNNLVDKWLSRV